jgi:hypothetical protein
MRKRVRLVRILVALVSATVVLALPASGAGARPTTFFHDGFNGSAIGANWNSTIATSGTRWCSDDGEEIGPGSWIDPSTTPCRGVFSSNTYGQLTVGGGLASFSANQEDAFAYIWRGGPSKGVPFPATGDFTLSLRMAYSDLLPNGAGFIAASWPDTTPVGWNPPGDDRTAVFQVWGDQDRVFTALTGKSKSGVANPLAFHVYRLVYSAGSYSLFVDNQLWQGPIASPVRPTAIWIGNPFLNPAGTDAGWISFLVDDVKVTTP